MRKLRPRAQRSKQGPALGHPAPRGGAQRPNPGSAPPSADASVHPSPAASRPNTAPARVSAGATATHSARRPWSPYRRAAESRARRAGCGPGRLRRGEEQQVGVAGAGGGAGGARLGAGVLRGGDDDDLRGVEQPQRSGPEQGLQRRRA